jgi:electron transport complex protein RnfG
MAKIESNFKNIFLCLFLISALLSGLLGVVHYITEEPIEKTKTAKKELAIKQVIPLFDELKEAKIAIETQPENNILKKQQAADSLILYDAYKDGEWIGTAIETFTDIGFSGRIRLMVGFLPNGNINKIEVLGHSETPGLGDKMEVGKSDFSKQFVGKNPANYNLSVTKDGGDVDAITAATISSRAYCDAVQTAYNSFVKLHGGENGEETKTGNKGSGIEQVIPPFDELKEERIAAEPQTKNNVHQKQQATDSLIIYDAYKDGKWIGTAIETFTDEGFSGRIRLLVGFLPNGNINKIEVGKSNFSEQFVGKNPGKYKLSIKASGGDVEAITGATISSRAYCDAVQTAYNSFIKKHGGKNNE